MEFSRSNIDKIRWHVAASFLLLLCFIITSFSSTSWAEVKKNKKSLEKVAKSAPAEKSKAVSVPTSAVNTSSGVVTGNGKTDTSSLTNSMGLSGGNSDEPIFITSDTLALDSKKRVFTYSGNVKVVQGDTNIDANIVVGRYDENNVIQEITCQGNVLMTRGETLRARSNRAIYRLPTQTVVLTESPEVQHNGSILNADKITVFLKDDRSEAEGNVRVKVMKTDKAMMKKP